MAAPVSPGACLPYRTAQRDGARYEQTNLPSPAVKARLSYLARFARFYWRANTLYRVHSPFVFEFVQRTLEDQRWYYAFDRLKELQGRLEEDQRRLTITDYGAGSSAVAGNERTVASLARYAAGGPREGRLLFRIVRVVGPRTLLEFGTSLGMSALYQRLAAPPGATLLTMEGCPATAAVAKENFAALERHDVQQLIGPFDRVLPDALARLAPLDYVFFDGNHRREPTIAYFEACLARAHTHSVFVFDDIHWSADMEAAWAHVQAHPQVTLTIDYFFVGIVFFRPEFRVKQHQQLVPVTWKPWMAGFFSGR